MEALAGFGSLLLLAVYAFFKDFYPRIRKSGTNSQPCSQEERIRKIEIEVASSLAGIHATMAAIKDDVKEIKSDLRRHE